MRILLFFFFFTQLGNVLGQTLTENDIRKLSEELNGQVRGLDLGYGVIGKSCSSLGRTLIYSYEVADDWHPKTTIREDLIENLKVSEAAIFYYKHDIDVEYYYFNNGSLLKRVSISSNELSPHSFELGEYISLEGHSKMKGVNLKIRPPLGWEVEEGVRPNVVKKFSLNENIFLLIIKENDTFYSRRQAKEAFEEYSFLEGFIEEIGYPFENPKVLNQRVITLDSYPTLEFKMTGEVEYNGVRLSATVKYWITLLEDRVVFFQAMGGEENSFSELEVLYFQIMNSVVFLDQYR